MLECQNWRLSALLDQILLDAFVRIGREETFCSVRVGHVEADVGTGTGETLCFKLCRLNLADASVRIVLYLIVLRTYRFFGQIERGTLCLIRLDLVGACAADFALLNLPKGKSLGRSKPATNSSN